MDMLLLREADLRACVGIDSEGLATVESAFAALARGGVQMPPILRLDVPDHNGEIDVKTAYVPGLDGFAVKMSPGFFDNPKIGLPSLNGLMLLFDATTGLVRAVHFDNGYLTAVRTALAGAVAARHLAPAAPARIGVLGAGEQARLQVEALRLVRNIPMVMVWARDPAKAAAYAEDMTARLGVPVAVADSAEAVVRECDLVVTTTPARSPLVAADWLHPGLHITAMGSDSPDKNELAPAVLAAADLFVCDRKAQSLALGEWRAAAASGEYPEDAPGIELGDLCAGRHAGRPGDRAVTVCDLTGTGVQDTAIALLAYNKAVAAGMGTRFES